MLSIYPTLLELWGLPAYEKNEGKSLVATMVENNADNDAYALTTYGMNNHAVKADDFRYIQYEDGSEELYDHKTDPDEFTNQAKNPDYKGEIDLLKKYLPTINVEWDSLCSYTFQPYWVDQKARTSGYDGQPVEVIGADH